MLEAKLPEIERRLNDTLNHGNLTHAPAQVIKPLLQQVRLLARQSDCLFANPPYGKSQWHEFNAEDVCSAAIQEQ
jgi:hypothetical protein